MRLQGKTALVTGAGRRVGRAIALALAERGANLAIHFHRSREEAAQVAREANGRYGVDARIFKADLARVAPVESLARAVLRAFGDVHVLVNSASAYEKNTFGRISSEDWDKHLDANLRAPFFLSQAIGTAMKRRGEGKIVNIADWAGKRPYIDYMPYCISKAGLLCLNTALAKALAPEVQVNAVLPGPVMLPEDFTPKMREAVVRATLVKRIGTPEDVARAVVFLIEGSEFITGAELTVDGGRLIA